MSLDSSAQVLIVSPGFLSMKNENLSIMVCRCHSTVEGDTLTSCIDPNLYFVVVTLFLKLNICEIPPKIIFKDILMFIKIVTPQDSR